MPIDRRNPDAPHGYDTDGVTPLAPYGLKTNGKPRLSNRGARSDGGFARTAATAPAASAPKSVKKQREALIMMADIFIATPLAGLSTNRFVKGWIGERQADALAGDSVIISHLAPHIAEGLIDAAQDKPSLLGFLDKVDEKAPWLKLTYAVGQLAKMMAANHLSPDPSLNAAGRKVAEIRMRKLAQEISDEAAQYGVTDEEAAQDPRGGIYDDAPRESYPDEPVAV